MAAKYPRINEVFAKEGLKQLTRRQRKIWDFHNINGLTQDVIAAKLGISQQAVSRHLTAAERRMTKWFKDHESVYDLLLEQCGPATLDDIENGEREMYAWKHKTPAREPSRAHQEERRNNNA